MVQYISLTETNTETIQSPYGQGDYAWIMEGADIEDFYGKRGKIAKYQIREQVEAYADIAVDQRAYEYDEKVKVSRAEKEHATNWLYKFLTDAS